MRNFFRNTVIFILFLFLFTEALARIFHISTDAPKTYKNEAGNIKFYPNQEGYWKGNHKWYINKLGLPGKTLPKSKDNLITVIGDSFIQNFMNPDSCRQKQYLSKLMPNNNFIELSRDGANLLEYFELTTEHDTLQPLINLMYVNTSDFIQSIKNISSQSNYFQVDLEKNEILYPKYQGSKLKSFLYNFKFLYYLYRKNLQLFQTKSKQNKNTSLIKLNEDVVSQERLEITSTFLNFLKAKYKTDNVIFVAHPDIDEGVFKLAKQHGFQILRLKTSPYDNWKLKEDSHWSCHGHKQVAIQVSNYLNVFFKNQLK